MGTMRVQSGVSLGTFPDLCLDKGQKKGRAAGGTASSRRTVGLAVSEEPQLGVCVESQGT